MNALSQPSPALIEAPCAVCGSRELRPLRRCTDLRMHTGYEGFLVECADCGLVSTRPPPPPAELSRYYPETYPAHRTRGGSSAPMAHLRRVLGAAAGPAKLLGGLYNTFAYRSLPLGRSPGTLLDVGCGAGDYLADMAELGWRGTGVELAPRAVAVAHERGLDVRQGTIFDAWLDARRFDLVTLWQVLEHLPDPVAALRRARSLLEPGGWLLLGVPNWSSAWQHLAGDAWWCLEVPRHLYHFTEGALRRCLSVAGFEVLHVGGKVKASMVRGTLELMAGRSLPPAAARAAELALLPLDLALSLAGRGNVLWAAARPTR